MTFSWVADIAGKPALHGSGLDELACLVLPMVLLGVVFLVTMRRSASEALDEDEAQADPAVAGEPDSMVEQNSVRQEKQGEQGGPSGPPPGL